MDGKQRHFNETADVRSLGGPTLQDRWPGLGWMRLRVGLIYTLRVGDQGFAELRSPELIQPHGNTALWHP
jgi:hypothetical protein